MALSLDLTGKVVLVTGGTRGIGRGITSAFLQAGAHVVTCSRSEVEPVPGSTHRVCDVRDAEAVTALVDEVVAEHGRLDVLVNNAGGAPSTDAATASPRFHDKILALNLSAPLVLAQAANRVMQEQGSGAIVNISSLAMEWGPRVRVNAIDVGLCRTEQTDDHYGDDARVAAIEATIPLGRMATPTEVGNVAVFLASDLASYVSGARVTCDGGGEPPVFLHI